MNCEDIQAQLCDYLDRSLAAAPMALVAEHLATCAPCREESELLGESIRQVAALPLVEPPLGFTQRVMARAREFEAQSGFWQRFFRPLRLKIPIQATALVLVGILGAYLLQKEETHNQRLATSATQATDDNQQDGAPAPEVAPAPPPRNETIALAKQPAGEFMKDLASPRAPHAHPAARRDVPPSAESLAARSKDSAPQAAPEPSDRATPMISGTAVANHVSSQTGGGPVTLSFPFESDTATALRSTPTALEPFADYELTVRRHGRPPAEPRGDVAIALRKAEAPPAGAERPSAPRAIDRLMAAIPDRSRPQTIWINVPQNQYEQFKKELQVLGTIESESRVPLLRDQAASHADGYIRVKLTAVPTGETGTPNPSLGR